MSLYMYLCIILRFRRLPEGLFGLRKKPPYSPAPAILCQVSSGPPAQASLASGKALSSYAAAQQRTGTLLTEVVAFTRSFRLGEGV